VTVPVTDKDKGWSALAQQLQSLSGDVHVLVGVQGAQADAEHPGAGATNAEVASWNEFGTSRIPARSFIRATIDIHERRLLQLAAKLGRGVVSGAFAPGQALQLLGEEAVGLIKDRINSHIPPPNAPSTIARKGSSTPLIAHTGTLKNSVSYRVGGA
jgi:hypothetical protein